VRERKKSLVTSEQLTHFQPDISSIWKGNCWIFQFLREHTAYGVM